MYSKIESCKIAYTCYIDLCTTLHINIDIITEKQKTDFIKGCHSNNIAPQ